MRRTQDLVLARLRLLAMRWRMDLPGPAPGEGTATAPRTPPRLWLPLVGVLALVGLGIAGVLLVRAWPRPDEPVVAAVAPPPELVAPSGDPFASPSPTQATTVVVHVVGEVRHPGIVRLVAGARVADALEAVGGLRRGGRLGGTNLARPLVDGERVEIGRSVAPPASGAASAVSGAARVAGSGPGAAPSQPVDLNAASAEQLDTLPGIGPVTASKILAWRAAHGRFTTVEELAEVPGIGPKTIDELRPHVRV